MGRGEREEGGDRENEIKGRNRRNWEAGKKKGRKQKEG